jgi:DNA (cytosine-5)-methyltransferase 1
VNVAVHPERLNIISLCTGGGGLDLGVELAMPGARSVVLVEREAFAVSQLVSAIQQGLMAEAAIWSDVATFNGRPWRGIVDGVIGGIPCQPHSLAGKRAGSEDERDLWSDARRIIVQSSAWFVLIENVSGMLSAKPGLDPGALRVRRDLQRLGFDVEGGLFTASEVGASHERERVFILAVADNALRRWGDASPTRRCDEPSWPDRGCSSALVYPGCSERRPHIVARSDRDGKDSRGEEAASRFGEPSGSMVDSASERRGEGWPEPIIRGRRDTAPSADDAMANSDLVEFRRQPPARQQPLLQSDDGDGQAYLFPPGPSDLPSWASVLASSPELEPAFRRVADGLASRLDIARVDRLRMLGNGVVPLEAAYAFRTLATRLAASGSPSATRLVRMMKIAATQPIGTESAA